MDQYVAFYSGLGHVVRAELDSDARGIRGNTLLYRLVEEFTYDGLGSQRTASDSMDIIATNTGGGSASVRPTSNTGGPTIQINLPKGPKIKIRFPKF